jgi:hypothetical protein
MKGYLLLSFIFFLILACSKDEERLIPERSVIPEASGYPVENHFPAGSGNQPFADEPVEPDPTKSEEYRLKIIYYHFDPYKESPSGYITFEYDNEGKIKKETHFDSPVLPGSYYTYEYRNGRLYKKSLITKDLTSA